MRGDCGSRTRRSTAIMSVANPVGVNRRWRPFRTLGRTPTPLLDRLAPMRWKPVASEPTCAIRVVEAREKGTSHPVWPSLRNERESEHSGVGLAWLPAEDSNLVERFQRPVCCRYTSGDWAADPVPVRRHGTERDETGSWSAGSRTPIWPYRPTALPDTRPAHEGERLFASQQNVTGGRASCARVSFGLIRVLEPVSRAAWRLVRDSDPRDGIIPVHRLSRATPSTSRPTNPMWMLRDSNPRNQMVHPFSRRER